tara:strand:- start:1907 stop:3604 length:1698 start_codon:yes stop_codon:yes gene_type:complete
MYYSETNTKTKHQSERKTESQITEIFQDEFFFAGCGHKFLGYDFSSEIDEETGQAKIFPGPRYWDKPHKSKYKWAALREHLTGKHRGIVRGVGESHIACVTNDLDRHDGTVKTADHIKAVLDSYKILTTEFNELLWLAEINPKNGSTKLFGFDRLTKPLKAQKAKELGEQVHNRLKTSSVGSREIFPHNSPQVFLPMRLDKITIVDTGILEKVERYTIDRLPGSNEGQRKYIQSYSLWAFYEWLQRGEHCCVKTLEEELKKACENTPDVEVVEPIESRSQADACEMLAAFAANIIDLPSGFKTKISSKSLAEIRSIPDAWQKNQLFACYCNRLAKRPLTADELLVEDHKHHIYNGEWSDGLSKRIDRYKRIAPYAARTFDPKKCGGNKKQRPILDANILLWKSKQHKFCKTSIGYVGSRATKVDRYLQVLLTAIIETVSKENGDCPRDSIQGWWEELAAEGKLPVWHSDTYTAARSVLKRSGIICVDDDRYYYVPGAEKGQCKGQWIKPENEVGERNYSYPDYLTITYLLYYKEQEKQQVLNGYDVVSFSNLGSIADIDSQRPPP